MVTREEVQSHIENGTFLTFLKNYVSITSHREKSVTNLEIEFPEWFFEYFDHENQQRIIALIRSNAENAFGGLES
jgi:hypothetical protein